MTEKLTVSEIMQLLLSSYESEDGEETRIEIKKTADGEIHSALIVDACLFWDATGSTYLDSLNRLYIACLKNYGIR